MVMNDQPSGLQWAIPEELGVPPDQLRLRLDFFNQAIKMTFFEDDGGSSKIVSAMDIAHALASELTYGTGLLPKGALWWRNTKSGPVTAIYVEPHVRQVALQIDTNKPRNATRYPFPVSSSFAGRERRPGSLRSRRSRVKSLIPSTGLRWPTYLTMAGHALVLTSIRPS